MATKEWLEYKKQYQKDHPDKVAKWCKKYQETHKEELKAKRIAKRTTQQNARLVALITDYVEGMTIQELCDKYRVLERK